ncbi:MAG: DcrB-related protein [Verrucomicrobiales bacterium]|nr:DcrB-related protein [Verrucomicrobiales bacterium]
MNVSSRILPVIAFVSFLVGPGVSHGQDTKRENVGDTAAISIPANWNRIENQDLAFLAGNPEDTASVTILEEKTADIEITDLAEYYEASLDQLKAQYPDFKANPVKEGEISGMKAMFTTAEATFKNGEKAVPSKMYLMMLKNEKAGSFYLIMALSSPRLFDSKKGELMEVLKSFAEKP